MLSLGIVAVAPWDIALSSFLISIGLEGCGLLMSNAGCVPSHIFPHVPLLQLL